jgi:hypothetical protein
MTLEPGIIRKLDEVVVNRIAAGEVIQVTFFLTHFKDVINYRMKLRLKVKLENLCLLDCE